jgi:predicted  nucleic acid-binding Zn-ribbon protein
MNILNDEDLQWAKSHLKDLKREMNVLKDELADLKDLRKGWKEKIAEYEAFK